MPRFSERGSGRHSPVVALHCDFAALRKDGRSSTASFLLTASDMEDLTHIVSDQLKEVRVVKSHGAQTRHSAAVRLPSRLRHPASAVADGVHSL